MSPRSCCYLMIGPLLSSERPSGDLRGILRLELASVKLKFDDHAPSFSPRPIQSAETTWNMTCRV